MLVVERQHVALLLIALGTQEPALRRLYQNIVREIGAELEHRHHGEGIGGILFASQNRQSHFGHERMAGFMKQHKQHVARDELGHLHALLMRQLLHSRVVAHFTRGFVHSGMRRRGARLRKGRRCANGQGGNQSRRKNARKPHSIGRRCCWICHTPPLGSCCRDIPWLPAANDSSRTEPPEAR